MAGSVDSWPHSERGERRAQRARALNSALLKAARELLYQASVLVAAMESSRREAAVSALVHIETLARGLRSAIDEHGTSHQQEGR